MTSLVKAGSQKEYLSLNLEEHLFKPSEKELFSQLDGHVKKYASMPSIEWWKEQLADHGLTVPNTPEVAEYYRDQVKERYVADSLKHAMTAATVKIKEGNPDVALSTLAEKIIDLSISQNGHDIVDFREALGLLNKEYKSVIAGGGDYGIKTGWPYLDNMAGGLKGGDMVSYIGRPGMGKTFNLLYSARHAWYNQKVPTLLVSMEMIPLLLIQRTAAMQTGKSLSMLKNAEFSTKKYNELCGQMTALENHEAPLWIVNGNLTATVEDIWTLCKQLRPELVLVDGAYLVKTKDARMGKWERIGHVAETLKSQIATDLGVPCVATYQFGRDASKKKKDEKVGLEDIYGSDAIGQVSSIVLALLEDDSIETMQRRRIDILKGRSGETGHFYINWDFWNMDFSEWKEEGMGQMQFL